MSFIGIYDDIVIEALLSSALSAMSEGYRLHAGNRIIVKDDVGRAAYSCYELPPEGHAYGRNLPRDPEGY